MKTQIVILFSLLALVSCNRNQINNNISNLNPIQESDIIAVYTDGYTELIEFKKEYDKIFMEPAFQKGLYVIDISNQDSIISTELFSGDKNLISVKKNKKGVVMELIYNKKKLKRKTSNELSFIEKLISSDGKFDSDFHKELNEERQLKDLYTHGEYILNNMPSKTNVAKNIFKFYTNSKPNDPKGFYNLGRAYLILGNRKLTEEYFKIALTLGTNKNAEMFEYLSIIKNEISTQENLNLDLEKLFSAPDSVEIDEIRKQWSTKKLDIKDYIVELDTIYSNKNFKGSIKILSYKLNGKKNYGAIYIPDTFPDVKLPAIVEAKGINWRYSGLNLSYRPKLSGCLDDYANKFIYIVPSIRGEVMRFKKYNFVSDGLPNESWSGAVDDYLAFFNVASNYLGNKLDEQKIVAFGDSRGGTTAMLAAIRNKKFTAVINWAGPTDWVSLMGGFDGITLKEHVIIGLNNKISPNSGTPGQFIDWNFYKDSNIDQDEFRIRILSNSPLYFLDALPSTILSHYGKEDLQVHVRNGYELQKKLKNVDKEKFAQALFYFHENVGHDLNYIEALAETKKFLINHYSE